MMLFENFSKKGGQIKEYDPKNNIDQSGHQPAKYYIIDTNKLPKSGDKVLNIDGNPYIWSSDDDNDFIGVIIDEIDQAGIIIHSVYPG